MGAAMSVTPAFQNPEADSALRAVLQRSLQRVLPGGKTSQWNVATHADPQSIAEPEFVMLTISGYSFRLILLLHYALNDRVQHLAAEILKSPADKLGPERVLDCLNELGNSLCGDLKREFALVSPHLGMSTPNRLHRTNLVYIADLAVNGESHLRVLRDGQPVLAASLYACTYGRVDLRCLLKEQAGAVEGASVLELF